MCRLLLVQSAAQFAIADELQRFAAAAKKSREFQGHGWGCSYLVNDTWQHHRQIDPVWESDLTQFGSTRLLLTHARSAFRDEGIVVENNMPFHDDRYVFIFNGELRGVRIAEQGRIGAEKIFNFIKRFDRGNTLAALTRGSELIRKQTKYIRAMNIILADKDHAYLASIFNEDPDYFTMQRCREGNKLTIASDRLSESDAWKAIPNGTVQEIQ